MINITNNIITNIIILTLFIILVMSVFFLKKDDAESTSILFQNWIDYNEDIKLEEITYIINENGIKKCLMKSNMVTLDKKNNNAILDNPNIQFFDKMGNIFYLSAMEGIIDTVSNCIIVSGNVYGHNKDFIIETDNMVYDFKTSSITSNAPVVFSWNKFCVQSDGFDINLEDKLLKFNGNVKSVFNKIMPF